MSHSAIHSKADLDVAKAERRARRTWVTIIVGLLGLQVAIGVFSLVLATGDSSSAIIPNYYQSAVNWDSTRRARQLTRDLQWQLRKMVGPVDTRTGRRELQIQVFDPQGRTVEGLNLSAKLFHHADGANIYRVDLQEVSAGFYVGTTALEQSGLWQVDLQIEGDHGIAADSSELWVE